jgi:hypothetical protein
VPRYGKGATSPGAGGAANLSASTPHVKSTVLLTYLKSLTRSRIRASCDALSMAQTVVIGDLSKTAQRGSVALESSMHLARWRMPTIPPVSRI